MYFGKDNIIKIIKNGKQRDKEFINKTKIIVDIFLITSQNSQNVSGIPIGLLGSLDSPLFLVQCQIIEKMIYSYSIFLLILLNMVWIEFGQWVDIPGADSSQCEYTRMIITWLWMKFLVFSKLVLSSFPFIFLYTSEDQMFLVRALHALHENLRLFWKYLKLLLQYRL